MARRAGQERAVTLALTDEFHRPNIGASAGAGFPDFETPGQRAGCRHNPTHCIEEPRSLVGIPHRNLPSNAVGTLIDYPLLHSPWAPRAVHINAEGPPSLEPLSYELAPPFPFLGAG